MIEEDINWTEGLNRQHVIAALIAGVFSIAIHIAFVFYVPEMRLNIPAVSPRRAQSHPDTPMQLGRLIEDIPVNALEPATLIPTGDAPSIDAPAVAEQLTRPVGEAPLMPRPVPGNTLAGADRALVDPTPPAQKKPWVPRQEILEIKRTVVDDRVAPLPRRPVPPIERIAYAPDIVSPVDRSDLKIGDPSLSAPAASALDRPGQADIAFRPTTRIGETDSAVKDSPAAITEDGEHVLDETPQEITPLKPIESVLTAGIITYRSKKDDTHGYFKISINRLSDALLPVIPKDVVLVQDSSASMAEQRLYFCRQGLTNGLSVLGENDRFNVISFKDSAASCFPEWTAATDENLDSARAFISAMRSGGKTDIYRSIRDLAKLPRIPGRPIIALVITDGLSTTGLTDSSDIIGEFSGLNDGAISVFTMGTISTANAYLLDLLSYCNRGVTHSVEGGRWGIPEAISGLMKQISRPVLSEVHFNFPSGSDCEVYPVLTSNLYLDQPLVLYGRYPLNREDIVFQAIGEAEKLRCDMVFTLDLKDSDASADEDLRTTWAKQKVYHLIGQYARDKDPATKRALLATAAEHRIRVPYRRWF